MDTSEVRMSTLFQQLGLPDDDASIARFIGAHQLPLEVALVEAPFWSDAQRQFLHETLAKDAQWAMVVDALNESLHEDAARARSGLDPDAPPPVR